MKEAPIPGGLTYRDSGVSISSGSDLVERIKKMVSSGQKKNAIGGFSGLYPIPGVKNKNIAACCDGVGTKLKIASLLDKHDTVGIDLVAMNVNDLICAGAKPLFFLDYFACGKLDVDRAEKVVQGIVQGCKESDCVLLGGETAEMPGFYPQGEYDLAGFAVGLLDGKPTINPKKIKSGDIVLGLPSSGLHSNGYSLVRKAFSNEELKNLGEELLSPTKIYVRKILSLIQSTKSSLKNGVKGLVHITGGGWQENIPRILPKGLQTKVQFGSWPLLPIFGKIMKKGNVRLTEMFRTFNMGIGMVLVVDPKKAKAIKSNLKVCYEIGKIEKGNKGVSFEGVLQL